MTKPKTMSLLWCAKWIADGATTVEEMAAALENAAAELREMATDGVELTQEVVAGQAFLELTTSDKTVAKKYKAMRL